ncbi:MAG: hypothetical protein EA344_02895 [Alkalicoccus sp.]|nr:MAG: hypothetical protein EA344_02895 [Alkalicoccus sp.]
MSAGVHFGCPEIIKIKNRWCFLPVFRKETLNQTAKMYPASVQKDQDSVPPAFSKQFNTKKMQTEMG